MTVLSDYQGREIRLTEGRLEHIERRPQMVSQVDRIEETLEHLDELRSSDQDETVHLYHQPYETTPSGDGGILTEIATTSGFVKRSKR